jgi:isopentenyl diphosphate isomerase/L-lactate dehydrogenase-like FMN-dependent dehydrogenase
VSEQSPIEQAAEELVAIHRKAFEQLMAIHGCKSIDELEEKAKAEKEVQS